MRTVYSGRILAGWSRMSVGLVGPTFAGSTRSWGLDPWALAMGFRRVWSGRVPLACREGSHSCKARKGTPAAGCTGCS